MRSIENTITAYPGQSEGVLSKRWVRAGQSAFFVVATVDDEILNVLGHRLNDILIPNPVEGIGVVSQDGASILTLRAQYTTNYDVLNAALVQITEHFNLPTIYWVAGDGQSATRPQEGVDPAEVTA